MKRKLFITFMLSCILIANQSFAFAATDNSSVKQEEPALPSTLSVEGAIEYALENSSDIFIMDLNYEKTKLFYKQKMNSIEDHKNLSSYERSLLLRQGFLTYDDDMYIESGVAKKAEDLNIKISESNKEIKKNEIKYDVEKVYFDLLQVEKELEIAKEGLELAKKQYDQSKKMFELGTISNQQLLAVELAVSQAQSGYDAAEIGYELQKMNFNNTLGLPLNHNVKLTDSISYKQNEMADIDSSIKEAFKNNVGLYIASEKYEIEKLVLDGIKVKYPEITYKYKEQEIAVEEAAKSLEMAQNGIEMAVRSAHLNLMTAEKQIATYEKAVEKAQKALELAQVSFELGQNTSNDVTQARIELMDAKKNLSKQIHAYNMALLDFKYSTGLGKILISK